MRHVRYVVFTILAIVAAASVANAQTHPPVPQDATACRASQPATAMVRMYPIYSGPLSTAQIADANLRPIRLPYARTGYNHHRELHPECGGMWILETLPAGTMVLVDDMGEIVYIFACGNRFAREYMPTPAPVVAQAPAPPQRYLRSFWQVLKDVAEWPFYGYK